MSNEKIVKSSTKKWLGHIHNVLMFVIIVVGTRAWQQRDMVSGTAPGLQGLTLKGLPYTLPAHLNKPLLVHFWANWCPICRAEQGSIASIAHDHPNTITIAMQSGSSYEVTHHMRLHGIDFPVVNDQDGKLSDK